MRTPSLVVGTVTHTRHRPIERTFDAAHYQWLVDLDALPRFRGPLRMFSRFDARDHLDRGRLGGGIRGDLTRFLAGRGIVVEPDDRVLMLAHARVLGHAFDPLSVFWCLRPDGELKALVLEVHNTYGERHAYLVELDASGRARVDKEFYVSPFNDTSGRYRVHVRVDDERLRIVVGLEKDEGRVLTAVTAGDLVPATAANVRRVAVRHLLMTQRVSLLIRFHGVRLWLARLAIQPRPIHSEEAVR